MTIRYKMQCLICDQDYLLRISIGHDENQRHIISCNTCKNDLTVELKIDFKILNAKIIYIDNCKEGVFKDEGYQVKSENYIIKILHPEFLVPEEFSEDPSYNANIMQGRVLTKERLKKLKNIDLDEAKNHSTPYINSLKYLEKNWKILNVVWKMKNNNIKERLLQKQLSKYKSETKGFTDTFESVLFDFNNIMLFPDYYEKGSTFALFLKEDFEKSNSKNDEYIKCMKYHKRELQGDDMKRFHSIYIDFFELFNDFKPLLFHTVSSLDVLPNHYVSSQNFEKTKMFYGQLYEAYASNISFITMMHNIYSERNFDKFKKRTLEDYFNSSKARRVENFEKSNEFEWFAEFFDSKLRNASHHGNISIEDNKIIYKSGQPLVEYNISYSQYLEKCTELFIRFATLLQLQLLLHFNFNSLK